MESCEKSAAKLVALVTRHFPGISMLPLLSFVVYSYFRFGDPWTWLFIISTIREFVTTEETDF